MDLPYIDPSILSSFKFKKGDIVVSVPIKCGTNWTMFIVYSILTRAAAIDFVDLYDRVPWLELKWFHYQTIDERVSYLENLNYNTPGHRSFKTHLTVSNEPTNDSIRFCSEVKYIFTLRNPCDTIASLAPFFEGHSDLFFEKWGIPDAKKELTDIEKLVSLMEKDEFPPNFFRHCVEIWKLRNEKNVLLLHFTDLKTDLKEQVKKVTQFLECPITEEMVEEITKRTSFEWMKQNENLFEMNRIGYLSPKTKHLTPPLTKGTLLRKGGLNESVLNQSQQQRVLAAAKQFLKDDQLIEFVLYGKLN